MQKKNYRLRDLMLSKEELELLNEVSGQVGMSNTDLARLLLRERIMEIKSQGLNNYYIALVGDKLKPKISHCKAIGIKKNGG